MKSMIVVIQIVALILLTQLGIFGVAEEQPQAEAMSSKNVKFASVTRDQNIPTYSKYVNREEVKEFFLESIDGRLMGAAEGKLAMERGTTEAIKQYGKLMVDDQNRMLDAIEIIAAKKDITFTQKLSDDKSEGLKDLKELTGRDFDRKFIKMMKIDHKRDVRKFKKATEDDDADVRRIATTYLPLIKSHLDKVKDLK